MSVIFLAALVATAVAVIPAGQAAFPGANGKIAFGSSGEIYVMNADGSDQTNLTNNAAEDWDPAWSPDGTKIVFMSDRDGNPEIYVMNADGTGQTRRTNNAAGDGYPAWSPDGAKIAFGRACGTRCFEIWVMNADGTGEMKLVADTAPNFPFYYAPAWSPDGTEIALTESLSDSNAEICVVSAADGTFLGCTSNGDITRLPNWSPDGTKIAFDRGPAGTAEVHVMNRDLSGQTPLTSGGPVNQSAAWSPDGTKIVFVKEQPGDREIYVMNSDGSGQTRRTFGGGLEGDPDWQPLPPPADLQKLSMEISGPAEIPVSEQVFFSVDEVLSNRGPNPRVDVRDIKKLDCPHPGDPPPAEAAFPTQCSWVFDRLVEEIEVMRGVQYYLKRDLDFDGKCDPPKRRWFVGQQDHQQIPRSQLPPPPPDDPDQGPVKNGDCIVADSTPGVFKEIGVKKQVELPVGEQVPIHEEFDVHCTGPSFHTFTLQDRIEAKDPGIVDPDPGNNALERQLRVACIAEADAEIVSMEVIGPPAIPVSERVPVTVRKVVHNAGPFGPADFELLKEAVAPPDCDVSPTTATHPVPALAVSERRVVEETFVIHCSKPSEHTFRFTNRIRPADQHVRDPNPANDTAEASLTVAAIAQADLAIVGWEVPSQLRARVSERLFFPTRKTLHNFGPFGPVDADVWKTMVVPAGAEGSLHVTADEAPATIVIERPDGTREVRENQPASTTAFVEGPARLSIHFKVRGLEVSVDRVVSEDFDVHCLRADRFLFTLTNEVMPQDPHVRDPNEANNRAERTLLLECPVEEGRMTGGGSVFTANGERVTHGFELHCDATQAPNNLQINFGGNGFHLETLTSAFCSDTPGIDPGQPPAPFDTYEGTGTGRCNGAPASISWKFTDAGEPGSSDTVEIAISGACTLNVTSNLDRGNHQAHPE